MGKEKEVPIDMNPFFTLETLEIIRKGAKMPCHKTMGDKDCILGEAEMYPHDHGEYVAGKEGKQWIYFTCKRCGYQWAIWKIMRRMARDNDQAKNPNI